VKIIDSNVYFDAVLTGAVGDVGIDAIGTTTGTATGDAIGIIGATLTGGGVKSSGVGTIDGTILVLPIIDGDIDIVGDNIDG
jgi:hypothetical protein